ncbi:acyl-CoA thioesterase [Actinospongicola halichondriae]|uniref:acyl-CoA thioesterase n=1 Tax=Actinospongicola halichondriae TaxID=3236844 RepID=UPI003D5B0ADE
MGDLGEDTIIERLDEFHFRGTPSADWEIWGPMGGYIASFALRAAGVCTTMPHPTSFSCHYLGVARFEPIDIVVTPRRQGRAAASHRVEISQDDRSILDAMVWSVADNEGLDHDELSPPDVPGPDDLPSTEELLPDDAEPPFAFWRNLDAKPIAFEAEWPPPDPRPAIWQEWLQFRPAATFADEWVDASRSLILVDLPSWPAAHRPHAWKKPAVMAPTLDLNVAFHRPALDQPWLLCDGAAPLSTRGMFGWTARVWSPGGRLHASGGGQCLYRPLPAATD